MHNLKLPIILFSIYILLIIPAHASANCTCEAEDQTSDKAKALHYKVAAIPAVLLAGVIGVLFPLLGKIFPPLRPETTFFFLTKAFAAGVILSTGFMHVLPEAFKKLTPPCLNDPPWGDFPFTGFISMTAAILTLSIDSFAMSFFQKAHSKKMTLTIGDGADKEGGQEEELGAHVHAHGHSHGVFAADSGDSRAESASKTQLLRHRIVAQVLEMGIIVHSVVIGITLGASQSADTVRNLFAALMFHQCFEGLGLGSCITQGKFKCASITTMALFFSLTTPIGIGVGMGISYKYEETSPTALIVQGVLNSASAGILIYMSLVDLLAPDFMHPKMQSNIGLQAMAHISLLLGAGLMSLLAKWA